MEKLIAYLFAPAYAGETFYLTDDDGICTAAVTAGEPVPAFYADIELLQLADQGNGYRAAIDWSNGEFERAESRFRFSSPKRRELITANTAWCYYG